MAALALDTHALVWYVEGSPSLSDNALTALQDASTAGDPIYVSSVCLVEIAYLIEKYRLPEPLFQRIVQMLRLGQTGLLEVPFTLSMAETMRGIDHALVPDMPDRMISATAVNLGVPLVTRDHNIQSSGVSFIW